MLYPVPILLRLQILSLLNTLLVKTCNFLSKEVIVRFQLSFSKQPGEIEGLSDICDQIQGLECRQRGERKWEMLKGQFLERNQFG